MVSFLKKLNLILLLFTALSFGAPYISPAQASVFMFLGIAFPYLVVANLFFLILWTIARKKFAYVPLITLACCVPFILRTVAFHFSTKSPTHSIKIMEYNVCGFAVVNYAQRVEGQKRMNAYLLKENPDIIAFLEYGMQDHIYESGRNNFTIQKNYPYKYHGDTTTISIYSKFPIENTFRLPINKNGSNGCIGADINIDGTKVRFYALHLQSNNLSNAADELASKGIIDNEESVIDILKILHRFRKYGIKRAQEAEEVAAHIEASELPVIVCGDFNDTPLSYTYHTLRKNLDDTFLDAGKGLGVSYNGNIPYLKIDNILVDKHFKALSSKVSRVDYSDHFPMVSEIQLRK